jgi:serine/threonine protein kinase
MTEPWASKWKEEEKLSRGGQGSTRLVSLLTSPGTKAVLKILNRQDSAQARSRMRREVVALDTLAKGGVKVPAVLDGNTGEYADSKIRLYFVMEHVPGATLAEVVTGRNRLELDQSAAITLDLCATVAAAHRENVLHRDLKPANVIVRDIDRPDLVIVDYGLSFNHGDNEATLTETGEPLRNEFLALPETNTLGGDRRDKRSDITALGAMLYYCLTGHAPGHLRDGKGLAPHRRPGYAVRQWLSSDLRCEQAEALLDRAFSVELENRFQTCEELDGRVRAVLQPPAKEESPAEVATAMGKILRQADRKILLAEFATRAKDLVGGITQIVQSVGDIRPFELNLGNVDLGENVLPEGFDKLSYGLTISVNLGSHRISRVIVLQIAAKGSQCVLLRHSATPAYLTGAELIRGIRWEELYWFDPTRTGVAEPFRPFINQSLGQAMRDIKDQVIGQ